MKLKSLYKWHTAKTQKSHGRAQQARGVKGRNSHGSTDVVEFYQWQEHPISGHQVTVTSASLQGAGVLWNLLIATPATNSSKDELVLINTTLLLCPKLSTLGTEFFFIFKNLFYLWNS